MASKMYPKVKTWNPHPGCRFDCSYCKPSFKRVLTMVGNFIGCEQCKTFEPHFHPERISRIPSGEIIWPCAHGDISFCPDCFLKEIVLKTLYNPRHDYYWQSKNPSTLQRVIDILKPHPGLSIPHIMLTTLETNRDKDYHLISKDPPPTDRAYNFMQLPWPRKIVTIEPIMDFDHDEFLQMICDIKPEMVYLGYNSHHKSAPLPQPAPGKTILLINGLRKTGIPVTTKYLPWEGKH